MSASFTRTAAWRAASVVVTVIANLAALKLCSRYLDQGVFAVVQAALQVIAYLPLLDGGFRMALNRELLARGDAAERRRLLEFGQSFYTFLGLGALVLGPVVLTGYGLLPAAHRLGLSWPFFATVGLAGSVTFVTTCQTNLLIGLGQQWRLFALNGVTSAVNLAGLWLGFRLGWGPWAFPFALLAGVIVTLPPAWCWIRKASPGLKLFRTSVGDDFRRTFQEMKAGSLAALRNQVFTTLLYSVDLVLVPLLVHGRNEADTFAALARIFTQVRVLLQAADEATWPRVAQDRARGAELSRALTRVNAWFYGAVAAAMLVTLPPFLSAFARPEWSPAPLLVWLMAARFVVTGLCSQPAYYLYGDGRFLVLARNMERELLVAVLLAVPLGWKLGSTGVALGFLLATVAGTLLPLPASYAACVHARLAPLLSALWFRALAAAAVSGLMASWLGVGRHSSAALVVSGAVAAGTGVAIGLAYALRRGLPAEGWKTLARRS